MTEHLERLVCDDIATRRDELVALLQALVGFDTITHVAGAPPRDEAALQEFVAQRLRAAGADIELGEPPPALVAGHRMIPDGFTFEGRPQLVARFGGRDGRAGRSLLFCGHIDVVAPGALETWVHPPFGGVIADGRVHGRGSCDMKGGVACMVFAAEALAQAGIPLAGELIVNTVSEEESTGAGGLATALTVTADAAIVPEPSGLDVWIACRGSLIATVTVEGRAGHAGMGPRHPDAGGAVNAIEKMAVVLEAIRRLREEWALRHRHPFLSPPDCVPTIISGGEWIVSHPASCRLEVHLEYLPAQADPDGWGSAVEREFEGWIARAAAADPWLADHPPRIQWQLGGVPSAEIDPDEPIAQIALQAIRDVGRPGARFSGLDNWHDGATLFAVGGIPALCLGPGDLYLGHSSAESVPIDELVSCAQALAVTAIRYCGVADDADGGATAIATGAATEDELPGATGASGAAEPAGIHPGPPNT